MDLIKVGKFIKEQRKTKGLTQLQLAQTLGVSEKTISKWECGNGFPDASLIMPLCEKLDINANELLSGRKLSTDDYKKEAEQNIIALKQQSEQTNKFLLTLEYVLGYFCSISFFILIFVASFCSMQAVWRVVLIVVGFLQFAFGIHFCLLIEKDAGYYECKHCGNKYIPKYKQMLWSMHFGRTRFMKCPKCGKKSWQRKVIK